MRVVVKRFWRSLRWIVLIITFVATFLYFFVPITKWLIVDRTLEVYNEVTDKYSAREEVVYEGSIIDTIVQPSTKKAGKIDTLVHRQSVRMHPSGGSPNENPKIEDVGVFGDGAGLLNAVFSFLAFIAVLLTIYLQSKKDDNDKRSNARVLFEQEFFSMTGMLEDIVSHLRFSNQKEVTDAKIANEAVRQFTKKMGIGSQIGVVREPELITVEGREVFKYIYQDRETHNLYNYVNQQPNLQMTNEAQETCFDGTLDHYFRYLYRILRHIDENELLSRLDNPKKERDYYAHLLRAQLSKYELLMLFYNGLLGENPDTIKKLIERYAMFNNIRAWELGKYQRDYYQSILDEELFEDPKDFDPQTTYSVTAFWSKEKLQEIKKRASRGSKEPRLCQKCWRKIEDMLSNKYQKLKDWCEDKPEEPKEELNVSEGKREDCEVPEAKTIIDVAGKPKAENKVQKGKGEKQNRKKRCTKLAAQKRRKRSRKK